jgi:glycolate oxidase iron-sulfur subunit
MRLADAYQKTLDCVHCGLCLPACPTYEAMSSEPDSPRGRIYLMRALAENRLEAADPDLLPPLARCLDCRACESVCPSGVRYGAILEDVRHELVLAGNGAVRNRLLRFLLDRFVAGKAGHRGLIALTAVLQASGLLAIARLLPAPRRLRQALRLLPPLPAKSDRAPIPPGVYEPIGERVRAEVGLFTGCMMETLFGRVNRATLAVLRHEGCRVHVPASQGCCGALHLHAGLREAARPLVAANLGAFPPHLDAVVVNAAGCGSSMKEYAHWHAEAAAFSARVRDLSELLIQLGSTAAYRPLVRKVAYDDACHLCHGQRIRQEPRQLLRAIPGLTLAPVQRPEDCCGSAGIYNLLEPELANRILERKVDDLVASGADVVVTGNPGCMLQIALGLRRRRSPLQVVHTAEVLAASIGC